MRYERPTIIRREPIAALLIDGASSEQRPDTETISDVNRKDNIVPVTWEAHPRRYAAPAIDRREPIAGLLIVAKSEQPNDAVTSDVHVKDNIVPVTWGSAAMVEYSQPAISRREPLQALLAQNPSDLKPDVDR